MQHLKVMLILKFSSEIIHADDAVHAMNDEISQTSLQIVKQIEAILEVILWEVSKLNDLAMSMRQGDYTVFLRKKDSIKWKMDSLLTSTQKYLTNWSIVLWRKRFTTFTRNNILISRDVQDAMQKKYESWDKITKKK